MALFHACTVSQKVTAADARKRTPKIVKDAPAYLIGPTWRGDWAFNGEVLVEEAAVCSPETL